MHAVECVHLSILVFEANVADHGRPLGRPLQPLVLCYLTLVECQWSVTLNLTGTLLRQQAICVNERTIPSATNRAETIINIHLLIKNDLHFSQLQLIPARLSHCRRTQLCHFDANITPLVKSNHCIQVDRIRIPIRIINIFKRLYRFVCTRSSSAP